MKTIPSSLQSQQSVASLYFPVTDPCHLNLNFLICLVRFITSCDVDGH